LPGIEKMALPIDYLNSAAMPREGELYLVTGFPGGLRQARVIRRVKQITSGRRIVVTGSHAAKVYRACGVTPETHNVIDFTRRLTAWLE
jgi:hypothetical protein